MSSCIAGGTIARGHQAATEDEGRGNNTDYVSHIGIMLLAGDSLSRISRDDKWCGIGWSWFCQYCSCFFRGRLWFFASSIFPSGFLADLTAPRRRSWSIASSWKKPWFPSIRRHNGGLRSSSIICSSNKSADQAGGVSRPPSGSSLCVGRCKRHQLGTGFGGHHINIRSAAASMQVYSCKPSRSSRN